MNTGTIPMSVVLRDCRRIYRRLSTLADGRSVVVLPRRAFPLRHGRSYWGYFRDARWLVRIKGTKRYTLDIHAVIDEKTIREVRHVRNEHRRNAELNRDVKREEDNE